MPIKLENVSYTYAPGGASAVKALHNISLAIEDGEFVGIMGGAGSGKSTLLALLAGLIRPSEGQVLLDGEDIHAKKYNRAALHRRVGLVFSQPEQQLFETTVERDVAFGLRHMGLTKQELSETVKAALEALGFDGEQVRGKSPLCFSQGERRRIAMAGVLAAKPGVLLLDEPVPLLDPADRQRLMDLVCTLNAQGTTVLMVTHDADVLAEHAKRLLVLKNGELVRDGNARQLFSDYFDLLHNGVDVPQVRMAAQLLRERGVNMPANVVTYSQFIDRLKILMWRKKR